METTQAAGKTFEHTVLTECSGGRGNDLLTFLEICSADILEYDYSIHYSIMEDISNINHEDLRTCSHLF